MCVSEHFQEFGVKEFFGELEVFLCHANGAVVPFSVPDNGLEEAGLVGTVGGRAEFGRFAHVSKVAAAGITPTAFAQRLGHILAEKEQILKPHQDAGKLRRQVGIVKVVVNGGKVRFAVSHGGVPDLDGIDLAQLLRVEIGTSRFVVKPIDRVFVTAHAHEPPVGITNGNHWKGVFEGNVLVGGGDVGVPKLHRRVLAPRNLPPHSLLFGAKLFHPLGDLTVLDQYFGQQVSSAVECSGNAKERHTRIDGASETFTAFQTVNDGMVTVQFRDLGPGGQLLSGCGVQGRPMDTRLFQYFINWTLVVVVVGSHVRVPTIPMVVNGIVNGFTDLLLLVLEGWFDFSEFSFFLESHNIVQIQHTETKDKEQEDGSDKLSSFLTASLADPTLVFHQPYLISSLITVVISNMVGSITVALATRRHSSTSLLNTTVSR